VIGLRAYFDMLATDPRLSSTAVQTVGSKGWDGFSLSIVTS
jgi:predicted O-methyltransferase YrrM